MFKLNTISKIVPLLILLGCTSSRQEWVHPIDDRLPSDKDITHRIDLAQNQMNYVEDFFDPVGLKKSIPINEDSKIDEEFYQPPVKVDLDKDGNTYIVHRESSTIHVYDFLGNLRYKIGGGGKGPGEFLRIMTFVLDKNKLYVLGWYKIEVYKKEQGSFVHAKTVPIKFMRTFDMCKLGSNLFLSGALHSESLSDKTDSLNYSPIFKIELETFEIDTSFGFQYRSVTNYPSFNVKLSETLLDCNELGNTITAFQRHFSYIFGYDENGKQKWVSKLDSYLSYQFTEFRDPEFKNPGLMPHTNTGLYQKKYYPRTLKNTKYALLQISHIYPQKFFGEPEKTSFPEINLRSIIVDTKSGELFNSDAYDAIMYKNDSLVVTMNKSTEYAEYKFTRNEY